MIQCLVSWSSTMTPAVTTSHARLRTVGGALGNLWDRLTIGHVVDFILVHYRDNRFPAFNAADSAITVGAIALIVDAFFTRRRESAADGPRVDA